MHFIYKDTGNGYIPISKVDSISDIFSNPEELVNSIGDNQGLHYSCHNINELEAIHRKFESGDCLFWDIDGYQDHGAALSALSEIIGVLPSKFHVVSSGNGLHILLEVKKYHLEFLEAGKPAYKIIANTLSEKLNLVKPQVVDIVFNRSKTLRLPATLNVKESGTTSCVLVQRGSSYQEHNFDLLSWYASKIQKAQLTEPPESLNIKKEEIKKDFSPVPIELLPKRKVNSKKYSGFLSETLTKCEFIKDAIESPQNLTREEWFLAVAVLCSFNEEGLKIAHEFSSKDAARYSEKEVENIYEDFVQKQLPHIKCSTIQEKTSILGKGKCMSCAVRPFCSSPSKIIPIELKSYASGFYITKRGKDGEVIKTQQPNCKEAILYFSFQQKLIYASDQSQFYLWDGTKYVATTDKLIGSKISEIYDPVPIQPSIVTQTIEMAKVEPSICIDTTTHSLPDYFIPVKNGLINLNTMQLEEHNHSYFYTAHISCEYNPKAECPTFQSWLSGRVSGDQGLIDSMLDYMAYALSGTEYVNRKVMFLHGDGGTGKSMFLEIFYALFGHAAVWSDLSLFESNFGTVALVGKRLACFDEASETRADNMFERLKSLSGTSIMRVEKKGKDAYDIKNFCRMVIACNTIPKATNRNQGLWDRFLIIPWDNRVEKKDLTIKKRIFEEFSGILNLLLSRIPELKKVHFQIEPPKAAEKALETYKSNSDHLIEFLNDSVITIEYPTPEYGKISQNYKERYCMTAEELFELYQAWVLKVAVRFKYDRLLFSREICRIFESSQKHEDYKNVLVFKTRLNQKRTTYLIGIIKGQ